MTGPSPAISVVVPVFNEAENLPGLYRHLTAVLEDMGRPFELVFADDGSSDRTPEMLRQLTEADPRVRVICLARNYGQHHALMAGLRHARGAVVVTIDADMQSPPEDIPKLVAKLGEGFEVVFGVFRHREHPPLTRLTSHLAGWLMRRAFRLPPGVSFTPFRAIDRCVVDRLVSFTASPVMLEVLIQRCTDRLGAVEVSHQPRRAGRTKYNLGRRLELGLTFLTHASVLPFRAAMAGGAVGVGLGLTLGLFLALRGLAGGGAPAGDTLVLAAVCLLGGLILAVLGVLGEYVARVQRSASQEPQYLVRERFGGEETPARATAAPAPPPSDWEAAGAARADERRRRAGR